MGEFVMSPILCDIVPDDSFMFTATVVISGIVIVVGVLVLLIIVFDLFGKFVSGAEARAKAKKIDDKKDEKIPMPKIPVPKAPVVEDGIPDEVVAVIAGAVAAYEGPGAVIRSVKKKDVGSRNPWAQAAQINNTKSF